jgi:hypothetical protein
MDQMPQPPNMEIPLFGDTSPPTRSRRGAIFAILAAVVLAVGGVLFALASTGDDVAAPTTTPSSATAEPVAEPSPTQNLKAKGRAFEVVLRWSPPAIQMEDARYEIRRNGTFVGYVVPPARRFTDGDVIPGKKYTYAVRVEAPVGTFSDSVAIRVSTPVPPLGEARVAGTFDVRSEFVSKYGYGDYATPGFGWRFRPKCPTGSCGLSLRDINLEDLTLTLKREGGMYSGSFSGRIGLQCGGTSTVSTGTIELSVAAARVIGSEWRATRLTGALTHRESSQLGCRSSGATLRLRARLYR